VDVLNLFFILWLGAIAYFVTSTSSDSCINKLNAEYDTYLSKIIFVLLQTGVNQKGDGGMQPGFFSAIGMVHPSIAHRQIYTDDDVTCKLSLF